MAVVMMTTSPEELERMRLRRQHDESSALGHAERKAIAKNTLEFAKKMKAKGYNINDIIEMTGLTVDDILRL